MSPERYPLVVFGTGSRGKGITKKVFGEDDDEKMLDAPDGGGGGDGDDEEQHASLDSANSIDSNLDACLTLNSHTHSLRCLVGIRHVEEEGGYASEGRLKRLLDGPKTQGMIVEQGQGLDAGEYGHGERPIVIGGVRPEDNQSTSPGSGERYQHRSFNDQLHGSWMSWFGSRDFLGNDWKRRGGEGGRKGGTLFEALVLALGVGAVSGWVVWKRVRRSGPGSVKSESREGERKEASRISIGSGDSKAEQTAASSTSNGEVDKLENGSLPSPPLPSSNANKTFDRVELDLKPLPDPPSGLVDDGGAADNDSSVLVPNGRPTPGLVVGVGVEDGEDTEGEGDVDVPATPGHGTGVGNGKKRARRGKRGKKKRPAVASGMGEGNGVVGQGGGEERESRDDGDERPLVVLTSEFKRGEPVKAEQQQRSALVLSDTILGKPFPPFFQTKKKHHISPIN